MHSGKDCRRDASSSRSSNNYRGTRRPRRCSPAMHSARCQAAFRPVVFRLMPSAAEQDISSKKGAATPAQDLRLGKEEPANPLRAKKTDKDAAGSFARPESTIP